MVRTKHQKLLTVSKLSDKKGTEADLVLLGEIERIDEAIEKVEETLEEKIEKKVGKDGHTPTEKELLSLIRPLVPPRITEKELKTLIKPLIPKPIKGKDGKDGISPNPQEIIQEVIKQIPPPAPLIAPVPLTGDETIEIINFDDTEKKIKKERVEGLDEIERLARQKGGTIIGGGYVSRGMVKALDLSASLDGSKRIFDIQAVWKIISVHLSSFPTILRETVDYTWTPTSLTLTSEVSDAALSAGQTLIALVAEN